MTLERPMFPPRRTRTNCVDLSSLTAAPENRSDFSTPSKSAAVERCSECEQGLDRRSVILGLSSAAIAAAAVPAPSIASDIADRRLADLGRQLELAQAYEAECYHACDVALDMQLGVPEAEERADAANHATHAIALEIESLQATTLSGLVVKARAVKWCRAGDVEHDADADSATDTRILQSILRDLVRCGA